MNSFFESRVQFFEDMREVATRTVGAKSLCGAALVRKWYSCVELDVQLPKKWNTVLIAHSTANIVSIAGCMPKIYENLTFSQVLHPANFWRQYYAWSQCAQQDAYVYVQ